MNPSLRARYPAPGAATALLVALSLTTGACGSDEASIAPGQTGTIQLALTALGSDGETYRLRHGTLTIDGATASYVDLEDVSGDSPIYRATVNVGTYSITLAEGWTLQRQEGDQFIDVAAQLVSPNPTTVTVQPNALSVISIILETVDAEVEFATGDLEVWLAVTHTDCEHGDFITRSCGVNLMGRQFRSCDGGWWLDWSECGTHCDRGYCYFSQPESFTAATVTHIVDTLDFTADAHGSPVNFNFYGAVHGDTFSDRVSFSSVGASNQTFPWHSAAPFIGQIHEDVALHRLSEEGHSAVIGSSAGAHNHAFFDGIKTGFADDIHTHAISMVLQGSEAGYTLSLRDEDSRVIAEVAIPPSTVSGAEQRITLIGDPVYHGAKGAAALVITPRPSTSTPLGTTRWSMNEFAFAR
ncbi:MAG: hypothetical protein ACPGU1_02930 [Myxococcota bacterium]